MRLTTLVSVGTVTALLCTPIAAGTLFFWSSVSVDGDALNSLVTHRPQSERTITTRLTSPVDPLQTHPGCMELPGAEGSPDPQDYRLVFFLE